MITPAVSALFPKGELTDALISLRRVFYAVGAFSLAVNILLLAPAIYMLQVYDRVLSSGNGVTLVMLSLIMLGLFALEAALEFVRGQVLVRAGVALDLRLGTRVFDAAFERTLAKNGANGGQIFGDLASIRQFLSGKGLFSFFDIPWTPIYILVIFLLHPWLGVFSLIAAIILLALAYLNERATGPMLDEANKLQSAANHYAGSNLRNAEVIEAMGMLPGLRKHWLTRQNRYLLTQSEVNERIARIGGVTRFFRMVLQSGILGVGAWLVIQGQLSPGGMVAASILLGRALSPVDLAIATWRGVVSARASYGRLAELLEAHPVRGATISLPRPSGQVEAEGIVVAPPGSKHPVLKGVSFRIPPGSLIAVIGASASGKSTLARALVGVWPLLAGAVRLDGASVHGWNREELGPWIGYLPQDVELFDGTVAQNIARFGELDSERIVLACQKAGVHEMVLQLAKGYETPIGESGTALSGGQRQRIALARALYGDPALIVLDEPNANLDDAGDTALIAALKRMKEEKRTVFVITHRVNLLSVSDAIMVMANGSIQAFGPRDTVLAALNKKEVPATSTKEGGAT